MTDVKVRGVMTAVIDEDGRVAADVRDAISVLGPEVIDDLRVEARDGVVTLEGVADRRSTHELTVKLAARTQGVVEVVDRMEHEIEDHAPKVPSVRDVFAASAA